MPVPNLIHGIPVTIQRILPAVTTFSTRGRAPVRQMWKQGQGPGTGSATELIAQVNFNDGQIGKPRHEPSGVEEKTLGYLLFRFVDLIAAGVATENPDGTISAGLARGDKISRIGRRKTNLYITFFRDVAGYDDVQELTLLEANFSDRSPKAKART